MIEFVCWLAFIKIVTQVVTKKKCLKKKNCSKKNCDNWKRLWWFKKIVIKEILACSKMNLVVI